MSTVLREASGSVRRGSRLGEQNRGYTRLRKGFYETVYEPKDIMGVISIDGWMGSLWGSQSGQGDRAFY